jgi:malate synthase
MIFDVCVQLDFQLTLPEEGRDGIILTPDALRFLRELHQKFDKRRLVLLEKRKSIQSQIDNGLYFPDYAPETQALRDDRSWKGAEIPNDLKVSIVYSTQDMMVV